MIRQMVAILVIWTTISFWGCKECRIASECGSGERCHEGHCVGASLELPVGEDSEDSSASWPLGNEYPPDSATDSGIASVDTIATVTDNADTVGSDINNPETDTDSSSAVDTATETRPHEDDVWGDTELHNGVPNSATMDLAWVFIEGGTYDMGAETISNATLVHTVEVGPFDLMRSEVTALQYKECVAATVCDEPGYPDGEAAGKRTYGIGEYRFKPVNYVSWEDAYSFCEWVGGYLPSEAQWEFAARSGGLDYMYPWGNSPAPDCAHGGYAWCPGRDQYLPLDVCEFDAGLTAQNLCDVSGNVWEWMADIWHDSYLNAPATDAPWDMDFDMEFDSDSDDNASVQEDIGDIYGVIRGAGMTTNLTSWKLHVASRTRMTRETKVYDLGFRCARAHPMSD